MDRIVFDQTELNAAVENGAKTILLCDNSFDIPLCSGISYSALGEVRAFIDISESGARELNISFDGFYPQFKQEIIPLYANVPHDMMSASRSSSFSSSYSSSFSGSFASSFSGSFIWEYEYETGGSFSGSFSSAFGSMRYIGVPVYGYGIDLI